jgi:hypothetical protein
VAAGAACVTKEELLARLAVIRKMSNQETAHVRADEALTDYINDEDVTAAYHAIAKWYA